MSVTSVAHVYRRNEEEWFFSAHMENDRVRLGKVMAKSAEDAKAKIQEYFEGGFFYPNQIYVWPAGAALSL